MRPCSPGACMTGSKSRSSSAETSGSLLITCLLGHSGPGEQAVVVVEPQRSQPLGDTPGLITLDPCLLPPGISSWRAAKKVHSSPKRGSQEDTSRTLILK